ncbi:MAG: amidohydrolase family protein [Leptonema sp. (in: bacteria)]
MNWNIYNATYATSEMILPDYEFFVCEDKFFMDSKTVDFSINLHGRTVLPSFVNSYDNLFATYLPYTGKKKVYRNWLEWDNELKTSDLFKERLLLDREDLYFLGAYKNIISGVGFVVDHIPKFVFEDLIDNLDIEILSDFGITHSPCSYSLNWGKGIRAEFEYAKKNHLPFLIRVGEGFDKESKNSVKKLYEMGVLSENTVLIAGISIDEEDIQLIKNSNSKIVWCPEINEILFGKTIPIQKILQQGISVCLGSGSSMQGSKNILSTIQVASKYIEDKSNILKMLIDNPIHVFGLKKKGKIEESYYSDFIILNEISPKSFEFITKLDLNKILLVVQRGVPLYASQEFKEIFELMQIEYDKVFVGKEERFIKKGFTNKIKEIFLKLGKEIQFPFFN